MGEIHLEWEDHAKTLSNKLWEFFKEEYLVDFSVACHGQHLKVHKLVLALMIPILKESLRSTVTFSLDQNPSEDDGSLSNEPSMISQQAQILNLDNIAEHAEDIDYLIQFAYTGKTTIPKEHADCLMCIAEMLELASLKNSLNQWHDTIKLNVIDQSVDTVSCDDVSDLHALKEESRPGFDNFCSTECCDNGSYEDNENIISSSNLNITQNNSVPEKCHTVDNRVPQKLTTIIFRKKVIVETWPNKKTETSSGETIKEIKDLKCPHCIYIAKNPFQLERHLKIHSKTQPKQFICKICKTDVGSNNMLNIHRDSKCGTEPRMCQFCDYKTLHRNAFLKHIMSRHQVDEDGNRLEKNVSCPKCDFVCYAKHQLRAHFIAIHERSKKYKCDKCDFTAPYINQLVKHEQTVHQKRRDYTCEECGFRFQTSGSLKNHVLVKHKGVKLYKCNMCNTEYKSKWTFKAHMLTHEGKGGYVHLCNICGHSLRRKIDLVRHLQKKHGLELDVHHGDQ